MRAGRAVEISVSPLFSLLQMENLGEPHTILAGGERYVSPRFVESERVVRQELADAGLGDKQDYLEFLDVVNVVQRASAEFYGWVIGSGQDYGLLVASRGRQAVSVLRLGETLRFERRDLDQMAEALVWSLPEVPVGRGEAISVGHAEFHSRARAPGSVMRRASSARPEAARRLDTLLSAPRLHVTKIYAAKRDAGGNRQRSERWLTVLDLVDGRWVLSVTEARREKWISAAPGSPQHVGDRLAELARSIR